MNSFARMIPPACLALAACATTPPAPAVKPVPALPLMATPQAGQMPAPVQLASLQPTVAPASNVQLVSTIQQGLASLGFYRGSIDGYAGDATARAIREFENFYSYRVTGQVNPDLVGLLRQAGAAI